MSKNALCVRSYPLEFGRAVADMVVCKIGQSQSIPCVTPPDDVLLANLDHFFSQPIPDHWEDVCFPEW